MERIKINKIKNEILVSFNDSFYKKDFIKQAINDFKEVCDISKEEEYFVLKPKNTSDFEIMGYEFYNYVLGLIKNQ